MIKTTFTSESVSEGHPDKIADQISDAILDAALTQDKQSRVAVETLVTKDLIVIAGEMTTKAHFDVDATIRKVLSDIGYDDPDFHFDPASVKILVSLHKQSEEIAFGIEHPKESSLGAGDQGMMFGFASDETENLMPLPIQLAHAIQEELKRCRKEKIFPYLGPDAKCQVSVQYEDFKPVHISTVVLSTQHKESVLRENLHKEMIQLIKSVTPRALLHQNTKYLINPAGKFVLGGPLADTGVTGRKIMVDTYGGMGRHGGGAFSGKDPTKVDRTAAYMARFIAKNVVAAKLATRCEIEIAYAIGVAKPVSFYVNTFNTGKIGDEELQNKILQSIDLTPRGMIERLNLLEPIYLKTASGGHFGRSLPLFPWERIAKGLF